MSESEDLDNDEEYKRILEQLEKHFGQLADKIGEKDPAFAQRYADAMRSRDAFRSMHVNVTANHDRWLELLDASGLQEDLKDAMIHMATVFDMHKKKMLYTESDVFAHISTLVKWSFLKGYEQGDSKNIPDAFATFINDDLNLE